MTDPENTEPEGSESGIDPGLGVPGGTVEAPPAPDAEAEEHLHRGVLARAGRALVVPSLAIFTALAAGALVIVFTNPDTLGYWNAFFADPLAALRESWQTVSDAYIALFQGSFGGWDALSETLVAATPLILAGLSVALAFQAGMFNIGGSGQFLIGATAATWAGFTFDLPTALLLPVAVLAGFLGGALWGGIVGLLKARTGAHEVISTIMLNYIALRVVDYLLTTSTFLPGDRKDPISKNVDVRAELPTVGNLRVHAGIILALLAAGAIWWVLYRSTWGFQIRAVGANPHAATYAGISVAVVWVGVMLVAGGLSGLAGASQILGVQHRLTGGLPAIGFNAIAIALLGRAHPFGVVAAAILFGALEAGAVQMQAITNTPIDIVVVIQALIILFVAAPELIRAIYRVKAEDAGPADTVSASWGS